MRCTLHRAFSRIYHCGADGIWVCIQGWVQRRGDLWDFFFRLLGSFDCVLPRVVVRDYYGGCIFSFFCHPLLVFKCLELEGVIELTAVELFKKLCYLLEVAIGQGLIVLRKVLVDRGNDFLVKFVEAIPIIQPILLVSSVCVELCGLLCPFGPSCV